MRKHELKIEVAATPAELWKALSTAQGIQSWFAPIARVEPGVGGGITVGWGPGMEFTQAIEVWEPEQHLHAGRVDYYIEGNGDTTILRLVESGFGDDAKFDGEFESTGKAWPVFMTMLKRSAEAGVDSCTTAATFRFLDIPSVEVWHRLIAEKQFCDALVGGTIRHFDPRGCYCVDFADKMLSVFAENCGGKTALTVMWLLYGQGSNDEWRDKWTQLIDRLFHSEPES
ncbi:MAG: SRPBCC family protein [Terriglobia bacterium]